MEGDSLTILRPTSVHRRHARTTDRPTDDGLDILRHPPRQHQDNRRRQWTSRARQWGLRLRCRTGSSGQHSLDLDPVLSSVFARRTRVQTRVWLSWERFQPAAAAFPARSAVPASLGYTPGGDTAVRRRGLGRLAQRGRRRTVRLAVREAEGPEVGHPRFRPRKDTRQSIRLTRNGFGVTARGVRAAKVGTYGWNGPESSLRLRRASRSSGRPTAATTLRLCVGDTDTAS